MKKIGAQRYGALSPGAKEILKVEADYYLAKKTGVTLSSASWASDPTGLTFSGQVDGTDYTQALVTVPTNAHRSYQVEVTMTFSDGAVRIDSSQLPIIS